MTGRRPRRSATGWPQMPSPSTGCALLHDEPDLIDSYMAEVVGGPDGFALPCPDYAGFAAAMRRKLLREMQFVTTGAAPAGF